MSVCSNLPPCEAMRACDTTCGDSFSADDAHAGRSEADTDRDEGRGSAGEVECAPSWPVMQETFYECTLTFTVTTKRNYSTKLAFGIRLQAFQALFSLGFHQHTQINRNFRPTEC